MDKRNTEIIAGVVLLAIIAIGGIYFMRYRLDGTVPVDSSWENTPATEPLLEDAVTIVTAKHAFKDGKHTIAGELNVPSPCHTLELAVAIDEAGLQAVIDFTATVKTGEICTQVVTPARFKVQFDAQKEVVITARLNGSPITLSLIDALPGEDLENFELYIKG